MAWPSSWPPACARNSAALSKHWMRRSAGCAGGIRDKTRGRRWPPRVARRPSWRNASPWRAPPGEIAKPNWTLPHCSDLRSAHSRRGAYRLDASGLSADTVLSSAMAQVVLNVLLLAAESLPRGGTVALVDAAEGEMLATLAGPRAAWPEGFAACLTDEAAAWAALDGPGNLLGPLAALLAFRAEYPAVVAAAGRTRRARRTATADRPSRPVPGLIYALFGIGGAGCLARNARGLTRAADGRAAQRLLGRDQRGAGRA